MDRGAKCLLENFLQGMPSPPKWHQHLARNHTQQQMPTFIAHLCLCTCTFGSTARNYRNYSMELSEGVHHKLFGRCLYPMRELAELHQTP